MKSKFILGLGGVFLFAANPLIGQEQNASKVVQVVYEVFSIPQSEAAQSQRDALTDRDLYAKMVKGLEKGQVKQEKLLAIRSLVGQKANVDHISQFIFPMEYDAAKLPVQIGGGFAMSGEDETTSNLANDLAKAEMGTGWQEGNFPATPVTPSDFTMKELGDSLEVEASFGEEAGSIGLRFAATHLALKDFDLWCEGLSQAKVPRFKEQKVQTSMNLKVGEPTLVGSVSPSPSNQVDKKKPQVWFAFVTVSVVETSR